MFCLKVERLAGNAEAGKPCYVTLMHGSPVNIVEMQSQRDVLSGDILFRIVDGIFQNGFTAKRPELPFSSYESNNFKENKLYFDGVIVEMKSTFPRILFHGPRL